MLYFALFSLRGFLPYMLYFDIIYKLESHTKLPSRFFFLRIKFRYEVLQIM